MTVAAEPGPATGPLDDGGERDAARHEDRTTLRRLAWFAAAVAGLLLVRSVVVAPVRVGSDSMRPTLTPGRIVLVDRLSLRWRAPRVGDVVTATDPLTGASIVKRVVAVGGDRVGIEDGRLVRNGEVVDEPHADRTGMDGYYYGPVAVPAGHVFLLGDARADSVDSRRFGPLPADAVDGRVVTGLGG